MKINKRICRISSFLLCTALLYAFLFGCSDYQRQHLPEPDAEVTAEQLEENSGVPVISILVDISLQPVPFNQISRALENIPGYNQDFMVNIEKLPYEGITRNTRSTKLRTEILAGKGPDLFLCGSNRMGIWGEDFSSEPFFQMPEQAMDNSIFLPMDGYIENAEYMEWDSLVPQVMDAGRGKEGQMILPMGYYLNLTFFDKTEYSPTISLPCSWDDVTNCSDPAILCASNDGLRTLLGQIADYSTDTIVIPEDEFLVRAKEELAVRSSWQSNEENAPEHFGGYLNRIQLPWEDRPFRLDDESTEYHMIPTYNIHGGVTAQVSFYAAINRNARHPELAFKIVDYLLSKTTQQKSSFYRDLVEGMPVCRDLGSSDTPLDNNIYMSDANFQEYQKVLDQINQVNFIGALDTAILNIESFPTLTTEKELEKSVHEQYVLMEMLLAES